MQQLSPEELKLVNGIFQKSPDSYLIFKDKLNKDARPYLWNLLSEFDTDLFKDFMRVKLEIIFKKHGEEIENFSKNKKISAEDIIDFFNKCGTYALSLLIGKYLEKMAGEKVLKESIIDSLVDLIHVRNELYGKEIELLMEEYKLFLQCNVS